ncbi:MAG: S-adenosylmethionine:tRNA ribosyltransferase-isomerase, partial [bacterium]|nr:S-adenosylmethionine:tRNA ribosyltransferase-isomerase [bacterium]
VLTDWLTTNVVAIDADGIRTLRLNVIHDDLRLKAFEHIPLPPYITQNDSLALEYQTVYALAYGSLAAPTAGLHFTKELVNKIKQNHEVAEITLHVGLGTFAKLTNENLRTGRLHKEKFEISPEVAKTIASSLHITAVGTTTVRTLESATNSKSLAIHSSTDIFIRPGYKFKVVNSMITNFHMPGTSLLMLVAAFIADKRGMREEEAALELRKIYQHAINQNYRFYSFGDAMILV